MMLFILHVYVTFILFKCSYQHGYLDWPPQRGSLWRYGYDAPKNYNDNALFCGGREGIERTMGKCGVCGDDYFGIRDHEAGGKYALGIIGASYPQGTKAINVRVRLTTHHRGYFEFRLCPNNNVHVPVTQECLDRHLLRVKGATKESGFTRFYPIEMDNGRHLYNLMVELPAGLTCSQCVLSWRYKTGNSWGTDADGKGCLGCGIQEEFRNCADISIGTNNGPGPILPRPEGNRIDIINPKQNRIIEKSVTPKLIIFDFGRQEKNKKLNTGSNVKKAKSVVSELQKQNRRRQILLRNERKRRILLEKKKLKISRNNIIRQRKRVKSIAQNTNVRSRKVQGTRRISNNRRLRMPNTNHRHLQRIPRRLNRAPSVPRRQRQQHVSREWTALPRLSPVSNEQALIRLLPFITNAQRTRNLGFQSLERNPTGQIHWTDNSHIFSPTTNIGVLSREQTFMNSGRHAVSTFNRARLSRNGHSQHYNVRLLFPFVG